MMPRQRDVGLFAAMMLAGLVLMLAFAHPQWTAPFSPARVVITDSAKFESATSTLATQDDGFVAEGADVTGASILWQAVEPFDAAELPFVVYDLDLTANDKGLLLWRVGEQVGSVEFAGCGGTMDLRALPAWKGRVEAVGVALYPTDYLSGQLLRDRVFEVPAIALESDSWRGAIASLWTYWSAYRPWNGRSNHTGGFSLAGGPGPSLQAFVAACAGIFLVLVALFHGRAAMRRALVPAVVIAAACLALVQFSALLERNAVARAASSLARPHPELPLAAQPQIGAAAAELVEKLRELPGRPRVLVHGASLFLTEYPTYLLRAHNAATLPYPDALPKELAEEVFLVLVGPGTWQFDLAAGRLNFGSQTRDAQLYFDGGVLRVYRLPASEKAA